MDALALACSFRAFWSGIQIKPTRENSPRQTKRSKHCRTALHANNTQYITRTYQPPLGDPHTIPSLTYIRAKRTQREKRNHTTTLKVAGLADHCLGRECNTIGDPASSSGIRGRGLFSNLRSGHVTQRNTLLVSAM